MERGVRRQRTQLLLNNEAHSYEGLHPTNNSTIQIFRRSVQYLHPQLIFEWLLLILGLQFPLAVCPLAQFHMPSGHTLVAPPPEGRWSVSLWCQLPVRFSSSQSNTLEDEKQRKAVNDQVLAPHSTNEEHDQEKRRLKQKHKDTLTIYLNAAVFYIWFGRQSLIM